MSSERREGFCDDPLPEGGCSPVAVIIIGVLLFLLTLEAFVRFASGGC